LEFYDFIIFLEIFLYLFKLEILIPG